MAISDWPASERPREKLLDRGAAALSDAELLAIFLRTGVAGQSAVDLSRQLLSDYGSLAALLSADRRRFVATHGLGTAKFAQLQAVLEMARRHAGERFRERDVLSDPQATRDYLALHMADSEHEVFACLFLDNRNRVIAFEPMFRGTIDAAAVYPREVVKAALRHNAAALILAHNHPSGLAEPSQADRDITHRLVDALKLVDIRVLDHLVIAKQGTTSLAERGLM
ncbi:DNA repair protein RadC [Salinisphaera sp. Q1T1-3]|uniref:RadC family protein n=1 Tax=Salinisphaera sp. Q1T1-3 TaxID=2321229 RepID=UPI000E77285A|nr:DNA repair protein RadC [Salinisphaera sp. Q1T1-3]RJS93977.1 JAB domain-containing protein [Salinisphaera sp. Q1T1-3]